MNIADELIYRWLYLDDVCGSFLSWEKYRASGSVVWDFMHMFTSQTSRHLFELLHPSAPCSILENNLTVSLFKCIDDVPMQGFDAMFIPYVSGAVTGSTLPRILS